MAQPPNILLVTTDQQRWDTLGCYGNQKVKTPHIDALAATSLRPVIEGKANLPGMALSDYVGNGRNVRGTALITNRYKYAYWGQENGSEFYDLQEDPHEMRNLAHDPAAHTRIQEHHGLLTERLLNTTTPPLDMIGPEWP